jgi:DNA replication protein DnaC
LDGNVLQTISSEKCEICGLNIKINKVMIFGEEKSFKQKCNCEIEKQKKKEKEIEARQKQNRLNQLFRSSLLGKKLLEADFDKLSITKYNKEIITEYKNIVNCFDKYSHVSYLLKSHPGTGKSYMTACLINDLIKQYIDCVYVIVPDLIAYIKDTYNKNNINTEENFIYTLNNCSSLVLDDLGAENTTETAKEKLFRIINNRYNSNKFTIFITNETSKNLQERLGERTLSRILGMTRGNVYKLDKEIDWRKSK